MVLQEKGLDTVDANRALGLPDDCREYSPVRNILEDLSIKSIKLMVRSLFSSLHWAPGLVGNRSLVSYKVKKDLCCSR